MAEKPGKMKQFEITRCTSVINTINSFCYFTRLCQGTENFAGIRVGNGPTEDEAEIIQHDQLSQQYDDEPEVNETCLRQ